jgi:hypothetical protein
MAYVDGANFEASTLQRLKGREQSEGPMFAGGKHRAFAVLEIRSTTSEFPQISGSSQKEGHRAPRRTGQN